MEPDRAVADLELFLADRGDALLRTAVLLGGSKETGEDLLHAGLERLLRRWPTIEGNPEGYLRRTLYHLAADRWRQQSAWLRQLRLLRPASAPLTADPFAEVEEAAVRRAAAEAAAAPAARRHRRPLLGATERSLVGLGPGLLGLARSNQRPHGGCAGCAS